MNKYVVAFISFHNNELELYEVMAESGRKAQEITILKKCNIDEETDPEFVEELRNTEDLKRFCFDMDAMISDVLRLGSV